MKQIRADEAVIDAQPSSGYESSSGFRDAFSRIMGAAPPKLGEGSILKASWLDTELGPMIAIANEEALYLLEFVGYRRLEREIERLKKRTKSAIIPGRTQPIALIEEELSRYFEGKLRDFKTPLFFLGSPFQKRVWEELRKIPYGKTLSYSALAVAIENPKGCRAVAGANGANQFAIVIPCHRVINADGKIGGYGGGIMRKKWLLEHEQRR